MKAVCTSEMSVYFNETTHHYILESCQLHTCHCEPEILLWCLIRKAKSIWRKSSYQAPQDTSKQKYWGCRILRISYTYQITKWSQCMGRFVQDNPIRVRINLSCKKVCCCFRYRYTGVNLNGKSSKNLEVWQNQNYFPYMRFSKNKQLKIVFSCWAVRWNSGAFYHEFYLAEWVYSVTVSHTHSMHPHTLR
jgi:hypothetical protein